MKDEDMEKIIKLLEEKLKPKFNNSVYTWHQVESALKDLKVDEPETNLNEWISVNDKLPTCWSKHSDDYGSGYVFGQNKYGEYVITQLWNDKHWEGDDENSGDYITHWMPIPPIKK